MMGLRRKRLAGRGTTVGRARVGKRTKDLTKRLEPGDIAIIDHVDLDRVAADGLIEAGVVAVVNAAPSISGRYPNGGPMRLVVPHLYGWKSAKFLRKIHFSATHEPGFWEVRGYHNHGDPWTEERYS